MKTIVDVVREKTVSRNEFVAEAMRLHVELVIQNSWQLVRCKNAEELREVDKQYKNNLFLLNRLLRMVTEDKGWEWITLLPANNVGFILMKEK